MKIFFFTIPFDPQVGGLEQQAMTAAAGLTRIGHEVRLATMTPGLEEGYPYEVIRQPSLGAFRRLAAWSDIQVQLNVSLKFALPARMARRPLVYLHGNTYQQDDGSLTWRDRLKRRLARGMPGIANSRYTAGKLGVKHLVLNPYDDGLFRVTVPRAERGRDLVFLGRLVTQKGCDVLIEALKRLPEDLSPSLTIIGDGPERLALEEAAAPLGDRVRFAGILRGEALVAELNAHRIFVAPSTYEEPFGIVALEAMACGCLPVVSERGGLIDAIGPHGLRFANGDADALAERLTALLRDPEGHAPLLDGVEAHLAGFTVEGVARGYARVFEQVLAR